MYTPPWMISQRAESSPAIADLSHKLASSLDEGHVWMEEPPKRWTGDDEGDFIDDIISDLGETDDLQLSNKEAWRITQLLSRADLLWGYGISSGEGQLFDIRTPSIRRALDDDSITVLTGVAGLRLRGQLSKINRLAEKLTRTPHESRVLIGSLALSVSGGAPRDGSGEGFEVSSGGGIASSIQLFDTAHGDFRMRQVSRAEAMYDPFGN